MKKLLSFVILLMLLSAPLALAETNIQDMADEELYALRLSINEELAVRKNDADIMGEGTPLIELIPDRAFAAIVRDELGLISFNDPVTQEQLDTVDEITANYTEPPIASLEGIGFLRNLESLLLSDQTIVKLPDEMASLSKLKNLNLWYCSDLSVLPAWICDLTSLKYLTIRGSNISELPEDIGNLQNLKELDISQTKITELPASIRLLQLKKFERDGLNLE